MARTKKSVLWIAGVTAVAVFATVITFAVLGINRAGKFDQAIEGECAPLVVLAFRGSGEQNLTKGVHDSVGAPFRYGDSELVTNGWEGITLDGLFETLSQTEYKGLSADTIPVVPIGPAGEDEPFGYEAISAVLEASSVGSAMSFANSKLLYSATRGAEAATHLIQEYLAKSEGCPVTPKFVVTGYSQGAMAARHTAELNPESVLAVLKIGDPYQMPDGLGVRSEGASGVGIIRWKADSVQQQLLDAYYSAFDFTSSVCHAGDPICEFSPVEGLLKLATGNYGDHMDYYTDAYPGEAEEDALTIARLAYEQRMLALAAAESGESVSWGEANSVDVQLRSLSLSFAGTPTLFSVLYPGMIGADLRIEFDLDGDGVYETVSENGTVWATFDEDGPQKVGVRITDLASGDVSESTKQIVVAPEADGEILLELEPDRIPSVTTSPAAPRPTQSVVYPAPTPTSAPRPTAPPVVPTSPPIKPTPPVVPPVITPPIEEEELPPINDEEPPPVDEEELPAKEQPPVTNPPEEEPPAKEPPVSEPPAEEPPAEEPPVEEPPVEEPPVEEPPTEEPTGPSITIENPVVTQDDGLVVMGTGFEPGIYVMINVVGSDDAQTEAFVQDDGTFESWLWIGDWITPGQYSILVREFDSETGTFGNEFFETFTVIGSQSPGDGEQSGLLKDGPIDVKRVEDQF